MKFLVKIDMEFDLTFEISDGKNLVKFLGRTFLPARKARKVSGRTSKQISEKISEISFQISRLFSETSFSRRAVLTIKCRFGDLRAAPNWAHIGVAFVHGVPNALHFTHVNASPTPSSVPQVRFAQILLWEVLGGGCVAA